MGGHSVPPPAVAPLCAGARVRTCVSMHVPVCTCARACFCVCLCACEPAVHMDSCALPHPAPGPSFPSLKDFSEFRVQQEADRPQTRRDSIFTQTCSLLDPQVHVSCGDTVSLKREAGDSIGTGHGAREASVSAQGPRELSGACTCVRVCDVYVYNVQNTCLQNKYYRIILPLSIYKYIIVYYI